MVLIQQFTGCKLEDTETDPNSCFLKLEKISMTMTAIKKVYKDGDFELKAHLLGNLPEGYDDVKAKLHGKEASCTVRQIEKEIVTK
eukprot:scaffold1157_cov122-Cylindrotheca_fusiformis.AAC.7